MKLLGAYVDDELAGRFSELARAHGGKSALLRRLVRRALDGRDGSEPSLPLTADPAGRAVCLSVRLFADEVAEVKKAAAARGVKPAQWLRAMVRVRLGAGPQYAPDELHQLRALTNQVRRIGVNLNQIARAVNEARLEGAPFSVDAEALEAAGAEAARTLAALHAMARGNVRAWEGEAGERS
jgi:hypothetical protein